MYIFPPLPHTHTITWRGGKETKKIQNLWWLSKCKGWLLIKMRLPPKSLLFDPSDLLLMLVFLFLLQTGSGTGSSVSIGISLSRCRHINTQGTHCCCHSAWSHPHDIITPIFFPQFNKETIQALFGLPAQIHLLAYPDLIQIVFFHLISD